MSRRTATNEFFLSRLFGFHTCCCAGAPCWLGKIPQNCRMRKDKQARVAAEEECRSELEPINTQVCDHFSLLSARDSEKMLLPSVDSGRSVCTFKWVSYLLSLSKLFARWYLNTCCFCQGHAGRAGAAKHCGCSSARQWAVRQKTNGIISSVGFHLIICCMLSDKLILLLHARGQRFPSLPILSFFRCTLNVKTTGKEMPGRN